jgi:hypothetical protein
MGVVRVDASAADGRRDEQENITGYHAHYVFAADLSTFSALVAPLDSPSGAPLHQQA